MVVAVVVSGLVVMAVQAAVVVDVMLTGVVTMVEVLYNNLQTQVAAPIMDTVVETKTKPIPTSVAAAVVLVVLVVLTAAAV